MIDAANRAGDDGRRLSQEEAKRFKAYKLIRKWDATDAAVNDSQKLDDVLDLSNTGKGSGRTVPTARSRSRQA